MMTEPSFPIAPTPELVKEWFLNAKEACPDKSIAGVAVQAARWGADQELEACVSYVDNNFSGNKARALRALRRPKLPSLKERALETFNKLEHLFDGYGMDGSTIRRALEALPDD